MKSLTRIILFLGAFVLIAASASQGQGYLPAVWVDVNEITGLTADGMIPIGGNITIPVRFTNIDEPRTLVNNGYDFKSQYDVTWSNLSGQWNSEYPWCPEVIICDPEPCPYYFDWCFINYFDDGIGFAGISGPIGTGLPADFDGIAYFIKLDNIQGPPGAMLTMDSTWWQPGNIWVWSGVNEMVDWWGPYSWPIVYPPPPETWCTPQPTILRESDRLIEFHFRPNNPDDVNLESIRIQGQIPPYEGYPVVDGDVITTACLLTRFLGFSGFRPIPPEGIQSTYTLYYETYSGEVVILTGDYVLQTYQGDINWDGKVNIEDVMYMTNYFFDGGPPCRLWGEDMSHFMDLDRNGRVDLNDVSKLMDIVEL